MKRKGLTSCLTLVMRSTRGGREGLSYLQRGQRALHSLQVNRSIDGAEMMDALNLRAILRDSLAERNRDQLRHEASRLRRGLWSWVTKHKRRIYGRVTDGVAWFDSEEGLRATEKLIRSCKLLTEDQASVMRSIYIHNMSMSEAAFVRDVSKQSISRMHRRAVRTMKRCLKQ